MVDLSQSAWREHCIRPGASGRHRPRKGRLPRPPVRRQDQFARPPPAPPPQPRRPARAGSCKPRYSDRGAGSGPGPLPRAPGGHGAAPRRLVAGAERYPRSRFRWHPGNPAQCPGRLVAGAGVERLRRRARPSALELAALLTGRRVRGSLGRARRLWPLPCHCTPTAQTGRRAPRRPRHA